MKGDLDIFVCEGCGEIVCGDQGLYNFKRCENCMSNGLDRLNNEYSEFLGKEHSDE